MAGLRRLLRCCTRDACSQVRRIEGIAGCRGVDGSHHMRRWNVGPPARSLDQAAERPALDDDLANPMGLEARETSGGVRVAEQSLLVLEGGQRKVDQRQDGI